MSKFRSQNQYAWERGCAELCRARCKDDTPFQFWVLRVCCGWACGSWLIIDLKIIICILFTLCCSWFCLRTVSEEWLILRLFILTHPGEEMVAGHLWAFSAPLCDRNPLFCAPLPRPATLALCQCRGEQWVSTVVLNHFPALHGLLSPVPSREGVLQSCWQLRRGWAGRGCMAFPLAQLGTTGASCHCIGSKAVNVVFLSEVKVTEK